MGIFASAAGTVGSSYLFFLANRVVGCAVSRAFLAAGARGFFRDARAQVLGPVSPLIVVVESAADSLVVRLVASPLDCLLFLPCLLDGTAVTTLAPARTLPVCTDDDAWTGVALTDVPLAPPETVFFLAEAAGTSAAASVETVSCNWCCPCVNKFRSIFSLLFSAESIKSGFRRSSRLYLRQSATSEHECCTSGGGGGAPFAYAAPVDRHHCCAFIRGRGTNALSFDLLASSVWKEHRKPGDITCNGQRNTQVRAGLKCCPTTTVTLTKPPSTSKRTPYIHSKVSPALLQCPEKFACLLDTPPFCSVTLLERCRPARSNQSQNK